MSSSSHEELPHWGRWRLRVVSRTPSALVVDGVADAAAEALSPADYLHAVLLAPEHRAQTFALVDTVGLLVCRDVATEHPTYRPVRGRSSRGRLSQGEYFHHDGCSAPEKPRVVEIRCPHQEVPRTVATAVAPFPDTVRAMVRVLEETPVEDGSLVGWVGRLREGEDLPRADWDRVQGLVTRAVRGQLDAESARAYFRDVDAEAGAYREPWQMGESRLIANHNAARTMQHRRAYLAPHVGGQPQGRLVKRWPAEELDALRAASLAPTCVEEFSAES